MLALIDAIVNLWSFGVMHNYAVDSSAHRIKALRRNLAVEGKLDAEKERETDQLKLTMNLNAVPNWLSAVNMMSFIAGLVRKSLALCRLQKRPRFLVRGLTE